MMCVTECTDASTLNLETRQTSVMSFALRLGLVKVIACTFG